MVVNRAQFEQLPMFATARELREHYTPWDYNEQAHEGDPEIMWEQKHEEVWDEGLYHQIADEGVKKPVNVHHTAHDRELLNGHHRVAAQYDADPEAFIPLNHTHDPFEHEPMLIPRHRGYNYGGA